MLLLFAFVSCNTLAQSQQHPHSDPVLSLDVADTAATRRATLGIILANTAAVAWYGKKNWWEQGFGGGFDAQKEGWFGQNTYSGGADKLGHLYMTYAGTRLYSKAFEWVGNNPEKSRALAAGLMFGTFLQSR